MQNITPEFTKCSPCHTAFGAQAELQTTCETIQHFLSRTDIAADVFVMDRDENYPVIVLTPQKGKTISEIRSALEQHDCACRGMQGVKFRDILANVEKEGNKHWGVVLNASQYVVRNIMANFPEVGLGAKASGPTATPA